MWHNHSRRAGSGSPLQIRDRANRAAPAPHSGREQQHAYLRGGTAATAAATFATRVER